MVMAAARGRAVGRRVVSHPNAPLTRLNVIDGQRERRVTVSWDERGKSDGKGLRMVSVLRRKTAVARG
jgi:hypothetical protein